MLFGPRHQWKWRMALFVIAIGSLAVSVYYMNAKTDSLEKPKVTYHLPKKSGSDVSILNEKFSVGYDALPNSENLQPNNANETPHKAVETVEDLSDMLVDELLEEPAYLGEDHTLYDVLLSLDEDEPTNNVMPQTISEVWESIGLSDFALRQTMDLIPLDPDEYLSNVPEMVTILEGVQRSIHTFLKNDAATLSLDEARYIVKTLNDDPSTTPDEFRYITRELFTSETQEILRREGVIQ